MSTIIIKVFVKSFNEDEVICFIPESNSYRIFKKEPLFVGVKLFKGLNAVVQIEHGSGFIQTTLIEMKFKHIKHLLNYYVKQDFNYKIS